MLNTVVASSLLCSLRDDYYSSSNVAEQICVSVLPGHNLHPQLLCSVMCWRQLFVFQQLRGIGPMFVHCARITRE